MAKYAVIRFGPRQYKVGEGQEILVDKIDPENVSPDVLLVAAGEKVKVGKPKVAGAKIKIKILGEEKGEKIRVLKYKAKSRYRKQMGFRPQYTRLLIEKIST